MYGFNTEGRERGELIPANEEISASSLLSVGKYAI
jgi:hypothetical protein